MNNFNKKIEDILNLLSEDRCKSRADKVYGKKTSAYKSGELLWRILSKWANLAPDRNMQILLGADPQF